MKCVRRESHEPGLGETTRDIHNVGVQPAIFMYDQDGSAGSTYAATEIVELVGVQVDAGINEAHVYTGL